MKFIEANSLKIRLGKRFSSDARRIMEIVKETVDEMPEERVIPIAFIDTWCKREFGEWQSRDILRLLNAWNKSKDLVSPFKDR